MTITSIEYMGSKELNGTYLISPQSVHKNYRTKTKFHPHTQKNNSSFILTTKMSKEEEKKKKLRMIANNLKTVAKKE